jgi:hypothetical protein
MNEVRVTPAEKKKFQVLVNFVRRGVPHASKALANQEAEQIAKTENRKLILAD